LLEFGTFKSKLAKLTVIGPDSSSDWLLLDLHGLDRHRELSRLVSAINVEFLSKYTVYYKYL